MPGIRSYAVRRLSESAKRWRSTGTLAIARGDESGHDSIRLANRMVAIANVLRVRLYDQAIPDEFLQENARRSTSDLTNLIRERFPNGRIPGYVERA